MTTERTAPDTLTIAYIAMGAQTYMKTPEFQNRTTEQHGGELEFIDSIIGHALLLDRKADERQGDFSGAFLYEVAEPFGYRLAQMLAIHGGADSAVVEGLADTLIAANCI